MLTLREHIAQYWEDPDEFRPERFLGDYNKDAFVPFSAGMLAYISYILTNF